MCDLEQYLPAFIIFSVHKLSNSASAFYQRNSVDLVEDVQRCFPFDALSFQKKPKVLTAVEMPEYRAYTSRSPH